MRVIDSASADARRRFLQPGELLAIDPAAILGGPEAFFFLFGPPVFANERCGDVEVVRINGPLEYHDDGCGDSYESIVGRVKCAFAGEDRGGPPKAVALRIDSPGGVVAGLSQTVQKLREMRKEARIPLVAFADETAYSAAYALTCACDALALPRSGMVGSIGVISTMVDQTASDKKMGLRFVVIASGDEKADGHPHVPITDEMIARERPRIETLAMQFYRDVKRARGIPIDTIRSFQARRFLGSEATRAGVATDLFSWDGFLAQLQASIGDAPLLATRPASTEKKPVAKSGSPHTVSEEGQRMNLSLDALITKTTAAMATEKDPTKLAALASALEAYKKTKHSIEKHETEEGDEEDEEEEEEEEEESSESKGDETNRGDEEDDDEDDDEDDEDDAKKSSEERKGKRAALIAKYLGKGKIDQATAAALATQRLEKVKAALGIKPMAAAPVVTSVPSTDVALASLVKEITGKKSATDAAAALRGLVAAVPVLKAENAARAKRDRKVGRDEAIAKALSERRISPAEAKMLGKKLASFVTQYLELRPNALVNAELDVSAEPTPTAPNLPASDFHMGGVPQDISDGINHAIMSAKAQGITLTREQVIAGMRALNGKSKATPEV